jgi:ABC-type amino acid transport substrate-binding protein
MIAPLLPGAEGLMELLQGKVDNILIDRMNYRYADEIYRKNGLQENLTGEYFNRAAGELTAACKKYGINFEVVC